MKNGRARLVVALSALVFTWVGALSFAQLVQAYTLSPLKRDEVEFLHTAWLMHEGYRLYEDFFQHHSPFFFVILSQLAEPTPHLDWVIVIRVAGMFGMMAVIGLILSLAHVGRVDERGQMGLTWKNIVFLLVLIWVVAPLSTFQIRPELWALVLWLAAWRMLEVASSEDKRALPGAGRFFAASVLLGVSVALTPRALPPVLGLLLFASWFNVSDLRRRFRMFAAGGLVACCAWVSLTFPFASPEHYFTWVIGFSRASGPVVRIWDVLPTSSILVLIVLAALAGWQLLRSAFHEDGRGRLAPAVVFFFCFLGVMLEPRQFSQSLSFMLPAGMVLVGRFFFEDGKSQPENESGLDRYVGVLWTLAAMSGTVIAFAFVPAVSGRSDISLSRAIHDLPSASNVFEDVALRETICRSLAGRTVLVEPTRRHPICLMDASYYWRGSTYIADGALWRAGIMTPTYAPLHDVSRSRPALLGFNQEMLEMWGSKFVSDYSSYIQVGWAYLDQADASRNAGLPAGKNGARRP
jgi:hypothetical protein